MLDGWRSWGAVPQIFDTTREQFEPTRERLLDLLGTEGYAAARRTVINAHYTAPSIVRPMWGMLDVLGYDPGRHQVLEPGCGAGGFFDHAPVGARLTGVELDPATARIAAQRHPHATIRTESFAESQIPDAFADVVIGNVPFADVALSDPRHNPGRGLSMHNHFVAKSLHLTAPGGIVAVLTSRYTLDARGAAAREAMYELGDLLGAVRLPTGAHAQWAGTDAITDLVVFRRRFPQEGRGDDSWLAAGPSDAVGGLPLNTYFAEHPEKVLGALALGQGQYGQSTMHVRPHDEDLERAFTEQVYDVVDQARAERSIAAPTPVINTIPGRVLTEPPRILARTSDPSQMMGFLSVADDGTVMRRSATATLDPAPIPKSAQREVRELLGMRDTVLELLQTQAGDPDDTPAMQAQRDALAAKYEEYVARYGPINRYSVTHRQAQQPGADPLEIRRIPTALRAIATDPFAGTVKALEIFDDATQSARRAAVFTSRVVAPRTHRTRAESPADALAITLDTHGRVDLDQIAELLSVEVEEARDRLGTLVFTDPGQDERLVPAPEYLSGRVRDKLRIAREAAALDPAYQVNVEELIRVVPPDLGPEDINVRLGAIWLPQEDVQAFLREILDDNTATVYHDGGSYWQFAGKTWTVAATQDWGTDRRNVFDLADSLSAQKRIVVEDTVKSDSADRRVLNIVATAAAQEKADALQERFGEWVWEDPERAARLSEIYNDVFNGLVLREYDTTAMSFPGLAADRSPRPHQKAAVARMTYEPSVGLFHDVGAGKTAEMFMGCMELRRLGMVNKPAVVVPNHMLEQFSREWLQWYPQAQILAASSADLAGDKRRDFLARAALGDWDGIVLTQGAFQRIPVSAEAEASYIRDAAAAQDTRLEAARRRGDDTTIKSAEKRTLAAAEKAKEALQVAHDEGITFEQTGIDYLCVDEMHMYKNRTIESNDRSLASAGSGRATDLDVKISVLRARAGTRGRVLTGATATPIANSVAEMYTMQDYLRPDLLQSAGITDFDSWAVTFGQSVTDLELDPAGGKYRIATRFARFQNVPELLRMWSVAADVKTAEDLKLPTPDIAARPDGNRNPQVVLIDPTPATEEYLQTLVERADRVRTGGVDRENDNMLTITNDGRAAALDLRLVSRPHPAIVLDGPGQINKLTTAADRIHAIWQQHRDDQFLDEAGQPHPNRGALQIVFCDLGTPSDTRWSAYEELRENLTQWGMDPSRIRFIHEANNDADKARLFAACRTGQVDVIIGSTQKMGVGTNIQDRAVALHHLDCPWRPADIAQREGRIVRQGNQNPEVQIMRYVTKKTFDAYSWQTVERKAGFIAQVMKGRLDVREIEDIGNSALSFAEVKALAADDPNTLRRAQAQAEVTRLERTKTAHLKGQGTAQFTVTLLEDKISALTHAGQNLKVVAAKVQDTRADAFAIVIDGQRLTKRPDAGRAILTMLTSAPSTTPPNSRRLQPDILSIGGLSFELHIHRRRPEEPPEVTLQATEAPELAVPVDYRAELSGPGVVARLENVIAAVPTATERNTASLEEATKELDRARANIGKPFTHAGELDAARAELAEIEAEIEAEIRRREDLELKAPDEELLAAVQAITDHLPQAVQDGDALLYQGRLYAPAGPDAADPLGSKFGCWGHTDQQGQPVTGPHQWDADPDDVAHWIRQTAQGATLSQSNATEHSISEYGYQDRPHHSQKTASRDMQV